MFSKMNTVKQGTVGVGSAVYEFCKRDWIVSIPINDTQNYDIVVDNGDGLKRVQVKTTRAKQNNVFVVQLKSVRPNKTTNTIKNLDKTTIDYLFILCEDGSKYLIPSCALTGTTTINLGKRYDEYKLEGSIHGDKTP